MNSVSIETIEVNIRDKATFSTFRALDLDRSVLDNSIDWETSELERKKRIRERSERTLRASSAGRQKTSRKEPLQQEEEQVVRKSFNMKFQSEKNRKIRL